MMFYRKDLESLEHSPGYTVREEDVYLRLEYRIKRQGLSGIKRGERSVDEVCRLVEMHCPKAIKVMEQMFIGLPFLSWAELEKRVRSAFAGHDVKARNLLAFIQDYRNGRADKYARDDVNRCLRELRKAGISPLYSDVLDGDALVPICNTRKL